MSETTYAKLYSDGRSASVEFGPESPESNDDMDFDVIAEGVFATFYRSSENYGQLQSLQIVEKELQRTPHWLDVIEAVAGVTIAKKLETDFSEPVSGERISIPENEASELQQSWQALYSVVGPRLRPGEKIQITDTDEPVSAWQQLRKALGLVVGRSTEHDLGHNGRLLKLPKGFLKRAGLVEPITARYDNGTLTLHVSASPSPNLEKGLTVELAGPIYGTPARFNEINNGVDAEIHINDDAIIAHELDDLSVVFLSN